MKKKLVLQELESFIDNDMCCHGENAGGEKQTSTSLCEFLIHVLIIITSVRVPISWIA